MGDGCYISGEVTLGRYTQIGPSVTIVDRDHPTTHLTSYTGRSLFDGQQKSFQEVRPVTIGNDVWVGANSVVLAGAVLGDGEFNRSSRQRHGSGGGRLTSRGCVGGWC